MTTYAAIASEFGILLLLYDNVYIFKQHTTQLTEFI